VSPKTCTRCRKIPLPKSAKAACHQACNILAVSSLLSHKICSRRRISFSSQKSGPITRIEISKSSRYIGLNKIKVLCPIVPPPPPFAKRQKFQLSEKSLVKKTKKIKMSGSDSDSSVIILTDDDDDEKPIAQRIEENRGVAETATENEDVIKNEQIKSGVKNQVNQDHNIVKLMNDVKNKKSCGDDAKTMPKLNTNAVNKSVEAGFEKNLDAVGLDSEDDNFERQYKQDLNYVMAKFVVNKKVGFTCDVNYNHDPIEERIKKLLDRADMLVLKKALDDGGENVLPKELKLKKLLPIVVPPPPSLLTMPTIPTLASGGLSDDDSPNTTQNLPVIDENIPQMPVVSTSTNEFDEECISKKDLKKAFKFKPYKPIKILRPKLSPPPKRLKPAVAFPSIKTKSFKIPRAAKTKLPRWVTNGSLWELALTVSDNGNNNDKYCRTEKTRKTVPRVSWVPKRACEEFQLWLVRGSFKDGDDVIWKEEEEVEKSDREEVKRRREDLMWKEKVLDRMLGLGSGLKSERLISTRDPLGLDEMDSGTGTMNVGNSTNDEVSTRDTTEELLENELNISSQSMVTHIRTPTHTFCIGEGESLGTDCMDEKANMLDLNKNSKKLTTSLPECCDQEPSLSSLPGLRGPPPPMKTPLTARFSHKAIPDVFQPYPSPPLSLAPSTGFAFTRLAHVIPTTASTSLSSEPAPAGPQLTSQSNSVLSGLVAGTKLRQKLF